MKVFKIIGITFLSIGIVLFIIGLIATKGDISKLKEAFIMDYKYEQVIKNGSEDITKVSLDLTTNDVNFYKSENESYSIDYYDSEEYQYKFAIENGVLSLSSNYKFKFFNWGFTSDKVKKVNIYLPKSFDGKIIGTLTTGNITIENYDIINNLDLTVTTGSIKLSNIVVENEVNLKSTTGKISLNDISALKINSKTTTGHTEMHKIESEDIVATATTGSVSIEIMGLSDDYKADLSTTTGDIKYDGINVSNQVLNPNGEKLLIASVTTGNITISFI